MLVASPFMGSTVQATYASEPIEVVTSEIVTEATITRLIASSASKYGVSADSMYRTMYAETAGTLDHNIQSELRYSYINTRWLERCPDLKIGDRERSYGLAQIHICDHDVSVEQATDPAFAADFMAKHFAAGRHSWWAAYRP